MQTGALVLDAPGSPRQATLDQFRRIGIHHEQLTAADIRRRFPEMSTQSFWPPKTPDDPAFWDDGHGEISGYLTPDAGDINDPQLAARNIMSAAQHAGVTFLFRRLVRHVNTTRDQVAGIELDTGDTIHGPIVVNAGGPASDRLNQLAGVTGDMTVRGRPLRTETHEIPAPPGFRTRRGGVFVTDADLGVAFRPHGQDRLHISSLEPTATPSNGPTIHGPTTRHRPSAPTTGKRCGSPGDCQLSASLPGHAESARFTTSHPTGAPSSTAAPFPATTSPAEPAGTASRPHQPQAASSPPSSTPANQAMTTTASPSVS